MKMRAFTMVFLIAGLAGACAGDVVINELMYHPPDEREDLQYIELFNSGTQPVDLSGWSFRKGVRFEFKSGVQLAPGGFVVIARDARAFARHYTNATVVGNFEGKLSHSGEEITLANRDGRTVDSVHYGDRGTWPHGADGYSPSLERICPAAASDEPGNWAASRMPEIVRSAGTPGRTNDSFSANLPPIVSKVAFSNIVAPDTDVVVTLNVADADGVRSVKLVRVAANGGGTQSGTDAGGAASLPMERISGDARAGEYRAMLPGQPSGTVTRFWIEAIDEKGTKRIAPGENEAAPTFSVLHFANTNRATIPFAFLMRPGSSQRARPGWQGGPSQPEPARGNGAFVFADTNGGPVQLFDHVQVERRSGGWNVHFLRDQPFDGMSSLNVIFENFRWALTEPIGYEVYRRAAVPAPRAGHMRVWENGRLRGYHLWVEQVNKAFLNYRRRDSDGDMFKLVWYGRDVVGQHDKRTNPLTGHTNLLALIKALERTRGGEQWELIRQHFNVGEMASYYAVNHLIANWDGFHNNHFAYLDLNGSGKWEVYPWDLDKTFGDFDGAPDDYAFYDLPLTYGAQGDVSPSLDRRSTTRNHRGPFGGVSWWRGGGYFSRPLLANAAFRGHFLARLRELCETEFTEEKLYPWINDMERRLAPEVRVRALESGQSPEHALDSLRSDMESIRRFIKGRRAFLLRELKQ
jgi:hypothetical protein